MKNYPLNQNQNIPHQNSACQNIMAAGGIKSGGTNTTAGNLHEKLKQMAAEVSSTLIRDLRIRLLEPVETLTKRGNTITQMAWEYLNPDHTDAEWRFRKSPLYTDETRLLLESGPYEEDQIYRVTAEKDEKDFWAWTAIEKIETDNDQLEGVA